MQTFGPSFDDAVERELDRLTALVAAVENSSVNERTLVVYFYGGLSGRLRTFALNEYFVLQTAGGLLYTLTQFVLLQEFLTLSLSLTVFETRYGSFYLLTCRLHIHLLGVVVQTVDETLFDHVKIGLDTCDT